MTALSSTRHAVAVVSFARENRYTQNTLTSHNLDPLTFNVFFFPVLFFSLIFKYTRIEGVCTRDTALNEYTYTRTHPFFLGLGSFSFSPWVASQQWHDFIFGFRNSINNAGMSRWARRLLLFEAAETLGSPVSRKDPSLLPPLPFPVCFYNLLFEKSPRR